MIFWALLGTTSLLLLHAAGLHAIARRADAAAVVTGAVLLTVQNRADSAVVVVLASAAVALAFSMTRHVPPAATWFGLWSPVAALWTAATPPQAFAATALATLAAAITLTSHGSRRRNPGLALFLTLLVFDLPLVAAVVTFAPRLAFSDWLFLSSNALTSEPSTAKFFLAVLPPLSLGGALAAFGRLGGLPLCDWLVTTSRTRPAHEAVAAAVVVLPLGATAAFWVERAAALGVLGGLTPLLGPLLAVHLVLLLTLQPRSATQGCRLIGGVCVLTFSGLASACTGLSIETAVGLFAAAAISMPARRSLSAPPTLLAAVTAAALTLAPFQNGVSPLVAAVAAVAGAIAIGRSVAGGFSAMSLAAASAALAARIGSGQWQLSWLAGSAVITSVVATRFGPQIDDALTPLRLRLTGACGLASRLATSLPLGVASNLTRFLDWFLTRQTLTRPIAQAPVNSGTLWGLLGGLVLLSVLIVGASR